MFTRIDPLFIIAQVQRLKTEQQQARNALEAAKYRTQLVAMAPKVVLWCEWCVCIYIVVIFMWIYNMQSGDVKNEPINEIMKQTASLQNSRF